LKKFLLTIAPGVLVPYEHLDGIVGEPIRGIRHVLQDVRVKLVRDERILFETIRFVGIRRREALDTALDIPEMRRRRIHSTARTGRLELATVRDPSVLSVGARATYNGGRALLGLIESATEAKKTKPIEEECRAIDQPMAIEKLHRFLAGL
jgi:hypothetical protein